MDMQNIERVSARNFLDKLMKSFGWTLCNVCRSGTIIINAVLGKKKFS